MDAVQTSPCVRCGREDCIVRPAYTQATRHEPSRLLGYQGYCRSCDMYFKVESLVQLSL